MRKRSLFSAGVMLFCMFFCAVSVSFAYTLEEVQKIIKEKGLKWVAEDVPGAENRRLGLLRHDYTLAVEPAPFQEGVSATSPTSLDWRNVGDNLLGVQHGNYVTPVKDQENCGSCWAFATTATLESTTLISQNTPCDPDAGTCIDLSEQEMLSCSQAGSCNGGYVEEASDYISVNYNAGCWWCRHTPYNMGLPPEICYPYTMSSTCAALGTCGNNRYKIDTWYGVPVTSADDIKSALNTYGPLAVTFAVYSDFYSNYASGIYEASSCEQSKNKLVGYHAVSVVGYDDTGSYFIVKNSWGSTWANEGGYFMIGYSQVTNCVGFGATTLAYSKTASNGSITVTNPTASSTWQTGTTQTIRWTYSGNPGASVQIDLLKGGAPYRNIIDSTSISTGLYNWTIPADINPDVDYQIVVTSISNASINDTSDNFKITAPPLPSIKVTVPNGGERWRVNKPQVIKWSYTGNLGANVKIELLKSGIVNRIINSGVSISKGSYTWKVPSTQTTGSDFQIKITSTTDSRINDTSDNYFTIY